MSVPIGAALAEIDVQRRAGVISLECAAEREADAFAAARTADALNKPVTRRDLLAIGAYVAERHPDPAVRAALGEMWEYFTLLWREDGQ